MLKPHRLAKRIVSEGLHRLPVSKDRAAFSEHLRSLFDKYRVDCVFDVGANDGAYAMFLRDWIGFKGPIMSFEPVSQAFRRLARQASTDPGWHTFQFALGDEAEEIDIFVTELDACSSILKPRTDATQPLLAETRLAHEERIQVKTLDDVFPQLQQDFGFQRAYLKMDTQGYDLKVLSGGTSVLSAFVAAQSEASVLPLYEGMSDFIETITAFQQTGFDLSGAYPVGWDGHLRLIEFDTVWIRSIPT